MKLFVLLDDLDDSGPLWLNTVAAEMAVLGQIFDVTLLQVPQPGSEGNTFLFRARERLGRMAIRKDWVAQVRARHDPKGPNLLLVWAGQGRNLRWADALLPVWNLFSHRILNVVDAMRPEDVSPERLARFDLIACFCDDLRGLYAQAGPTPTMFLPPSLDTLRYNSVSDWRPIDLLLVGRREDRFHAPLMAHYGRGEGQRLLMDYVSRGQTPQTRAQEMQMLMATYARSSISFCYEPSANFRFRGLSPMLERYVHGWASGCTILGTRPRSAAAAKLMDWPGAMFDMPENPSEAVALIEALLDDPAGMAARRKRNRREAVARHDTRLRVAALLDQLGLAYPQALHDALGDHATCLADCEAGSERQFRPDRHMV
ncbi:MAG: glycosyltransferase [Roseinatronobacter sp.]